MSPVKTAISNKDSSNNDRNNIDEGIEPTSRAEALKTAWKVVLLSTGCSWQSGRDWIVGVEFHSPWKLIKFWNFWIQLWSGSGLSSKMITKGKTLPTEEELAVEEVPLSSPYLKAGAFHLGKHCEAVNNVSRICFTNSCSAISVVILL